MNQLAKLAVLMVFFGFGYAGYHFYLFMIEEVPDMQTEREGLEQQLEAKQKQYTTLRHFSENIDSIKQELRQLNVQLQSALEHMPRDFNLSSILRKLTRLAHNSGVELADFTPESKEERPNGAFYATTDIKLKIRGIYTHSLVFFDQITRLKRIINIKSIKMGNETDKRYINSSPGRGRSVITPILVDAVLTTYRFAD